MARAIKRNEQNAYRERLLKLLPSEVAIGFMAANAALLSLDPSTLTTVLLWVVFGVCLVATPLWLYFGQEVKNVLQLVITSSAFIIWAMTMTGPFTTIPIYEPIVGAVLAILFSFVVAPLLGKIVAAQAS